MTDLPAALLSNEAYDEPVECVKLIQTHISWVFLTGKYVYKVKKPVNFGFLDFSTLEKRRNFCEKEFQINSMFSPGLYLGVLPIAQTGNVLKIGAGGKAIEYCIKMRQLSQENLMSRLLENGKVGREEINRIIEILARYYENAQSGRDVEKNATFEITKFNWDENFEQTEEFRNVSINAEDFDFIKSKVEKLMEKNRALFEKRIKEGKVKWCHGDLHSGNIFIESGKIFIFDAIEFNERFACSDIANDVAFLAMDLDFRGFPDLSDYFVGDFSEKVRDFELSNLLNFYKCYRAYVRGKVISFKLNDASVPENEKNEAGSEAGKYFALAKEYAEKL